MNRKHLVTVLVILFLLPAPQAHAKKLDPDEIFDFGALTEIGFITKYGIFKPLKPNSAKFSPAGRFEMWSSEGRRYQYHTYGDASQDVLVSCGHLGSKPGHYVSRLCEDDQGRVVRVTSAANAGNSGGTGGAAGAGGDGFVFEPVDLQALASAAKDQSSPGGLQVHVQPSRGWVYTGVPTIAYLTGSGGSDQVAVDGIGARVRWEVQQHSVDFKDPSGARSQVVSNTSGAPYPNQSITWDYQQPGNAAPTVTTTWRAVVDIAGETHTFNSARTTTSTAKSFEVRKPKFSLTTPDYQGK